MKINLQELKKKSPELFATKETLKNHQGYSEAWLASEGLDRNKLKKLERQGLAIRGYLPHKEGHSVRWILLTEKL